MKNKNWKKVLYIFSLVVLILSTIFFLYSLANKKFSSKLIEENKALREDIYSLEEETQKLDKDIENLEIEFNLKSQEFYEKYGYQFESNKSNEILKLKEEYISKNKEIKSEIKDRLKAYGAYFDSNIYEKENYDRSVNDFLVLSQEKNLDKHKNIYDELEIDDLLKDTDGFADYLIKNNEKSQKLNFFVFYASIYSSSIYNFINDDRAPLSDVYVDINNLLNIYKEMERKSYNTGELSSENLVYLKKFIDEKIPEYYKNYGIIKSLEKSGKSE